MRTRTLASVSLLIVALGSGLLASADRVERGTLQSAVVYLTSPTLIGSTIVEGPVMVVHDAARMARGEPCTSIRLFDPRSGPLEEVASFHCIPRSGTVKRQFTITTEPNNIDGYGCVLTAYQFASDPEIHGVPLLARAH
jgi:hypothetical protein